jgi:hypothetical protein
MDDDAWQGKLDDFLASAGDDDQMVERLVRQHLRCAVYLFQQHVMVRVIRDLPKELFRSADIARIADHMPSISSRADASLGEFIAILREEIRRVGQLSAETPH